MNDHDKWLCVSIRSDTTVFHKTTQKKINGMFCLLFLIKFYNILTL